MDATRSLPIQPTLPAAPTPQPAPTLPASTPRAAPGFERRLVHVDLSTTRRERHMSSGAFLAGAVGLLVVAVAAWFILGAHIYG